MLSYLRRMIIATAMCLPLAAYAQDPSPLSQEAAPASVTDPAPAATLPADTANMGTVIFFRDKKFSGSMMRFKVREGGKELGKLSSGAYFSTQVPAGKHEFEVHSEAKDVLTIEVEPGETYYVLGSISMGMLAGRPNLSPSDAATFEKMKGSLKDVTGKDIDDGSADQ